MMWGVALVAGAVSVIEEMTGNYENHCNHKQSCFYRVAGFMVFYEFGDVQLLGN